MIGETAKTNKAAFSPTQMLLGAAITASLTFALLSTASAKPKTGVRTALDGSSRYSCSSVCFDRYNTCIGQGTLPATCMSRFQMCVYYCTGGGGSGGARAGSAND